MPRFSIIVPVYNVEEYLAECIDSILRQTYDDYEIILIDDGSTDNSLQLCREYEKQNNKLNVYTQENQGLAAARNAGIEKSKGEYLIFIDSDDYLYNEFCLEKIAHSLKNNTELVVYGLTRNTNIDKYHNKYLDTFLNLPECVSSGESYILKMRKNITSYFMWSTCMAYSKRYWMENNYIFPETRAFEDFAIIWKVMAKATNLAVLREIIYVYRIDRPGSITKSFSEQETILHTKMLRDNVESLKKEDFSRKLKLELMNIFSSGFFGYFLDIASHDSLITLKTKDMLEETRRLFIKCKKIPKHTFVNSIISMFGISKGMRIVGKIRRFISKLLS